MTHDQKGSAKRPLILIVPGLNNSGPDHWQSLWEQQRDDIARVNLGMWDRPHRNTWVNQLNLAIKQAGRPVILVAHSLGCHAINWWAALEQPGHDGPVIGALLVAPPEVDHAPLDSRLSGFGPTPKTPLPFASIVAASRNDPYMSFDGARSLAQHWGSRFADAGEIGHINAASGIGTWDFGQFLLAQLERNLPASEPVATTQAASAAPQFDQQVSAS